MAESSVRLRHRRPSAQRDLSATLVDDDDQPPQDPVSLATSLYFPNLVVLIPDSRILVPNLNYS